MARVFGRLLNSDALGSDGKKAKRLPSRAVIAKERSHIQAVVELSSPRASADSSVSDVEGHLSNMRCKITYADRGPRYTGVPG